MKYFAIFGWLAERECKYFGGGFDHFILTREPFETKSMTGRNGIVTGTRDAGASHFERWITTVSLTPCFSRV
jgi:hypothetical protein